MKSLYKQWIDDVIKFVNPESMWEIKNRNTPYESTVVWRTPQNQFEIEELFNLGFGVDHIRRKQSVARNFNLPEALKGAEIEINYGFGDEAWELGEFQAILDSKEGRYLVSGEDCDEHHLRMRLPRVKHVD